MGNDQEPSGPFYTTIMRHLRATDLRLPGQRPGRSEGEITAHAGR